MSAALAECQEASPNLKILELESYGMENQQCRAGYGANKLSP